MGRTSNAINPMSPLERRSAFSLASIYALRMLGLFMIFPVFSLYAEHLQGVTPFLLGIAISAYGLTQALLQIPFGLLSDRIGRKPVIIGGLLLFAAGSAMAAMADSIQGVILGRALQGSGAIAAAIMALAADLTREEVRTRIMAMIGISIGMSFVVAMVAGPLVNRWIGVDGIFWLTGLLALAGIGVVLWLVPTPVHSQIHSDAEAEPGQFGAVLSNPDLLRLDGGILTLHMILTAGFVVLPLILRDRAGLAPDHHWMFYLPVMLLGLAAMVPFVIRAEKRGQMRGVFLGAVAVLALGEFLMSVTLDSVWGLGFSMFVFFAAFNLLEATLPSLISKLAPARSKGTAMGVYSTSQFLGAFLGGALGGWLYGAVGEQAVFWFGGGGALLWLLFAWGMPNPKAVSSYILKISSGDPQQAQGLAGRLNGLPGVAEAVVVPEEGVAYLKIERARFDEDAARALATEGAGA